MKNARRRVAGEEMAHRRLARALHDDHGQRVAALGFELRVVRNHLPEDDPCREALDAVAQQLGALGEDLRRLSHTLHPAILEQRGLAMALRDACGEIEARHGLRIDLDLHDTRRPIPPEVALALYRIAQEALANTARHADAGSARLGLRVGRSAARLVLTDDGVGFDPAVQGGADGLGLASMEERARLLGGRCRVVSAPGDGTTVEVRVPLVRFSRWLRRRWGWVTAVTLVVLALGGGLASTLVQARRTAAEAGRAEAAVQFLEGLFASADPRQTHGEPPDARELVRLGGERLGHELIDQPLLRARLLDTLGGIQTQLGLYDEARPLLEEALSLRETLRDADHPDVAATLVRLGCLAHLSGQGDAEALFRRALAIYEKRHEDEGPELADLLNKLGATYGSQGRIDEAEAVLRRSLALHEELFGPSDLRVAKLLHNLGGIAYYRGQPEVVEALILRALDIREATLPEDDPELMGSREVLGLVRRQQGRLAEAVVLFERVAATTERVYGPEHPELARTLLNLGLAHSDLGEDLAACEILERALAIEEKALAPEHPRVVRTLVSLAEHHLRQGRTAEAEALYRRLLALRAKGVAYDDWDRALAGWQAFMVGERAPGKEEVAPSAQERERRPGTGRSGPS